METNIKEIIAKNILLSQGGELKIGPTKKQFTVPMSKNQQVNIARIEYNPGSHMKKIQLWVGDNLFVTPENEIEETAVYEYIAANFGNPDGEKISNENLRFRMRLREMNQNFIRRHGDLNPEDFYMAQRCINLIDEARTKCKDNPIPMPGDLVEGYCYDGTVYYSEGRIESRRHSQKELMFCGRPYTPFIYQSPFAEENYRLTIDGGPYLGINKADLEYVGKDTAFFCDWGHEGPCQDGTVRFPATVNRWKIKEGTEI